MLTAIKPLLRHQYSKNLFIKKIYNNLECIITFKMYVHCNYLTLNFLFN